MLDQRVVVGKALQPLAFSRREATNGRRYADALSTTTPQRIADLLTDPHSNRAAARVATVRLIAISGARVRIDCKSHGRHHASIRVRVRVASSSERWRKVVLRVCSVVLG